MHTVVSWKARLDSSLLLKREYRMEKGLVNEGVAHRSSTFGGGGVEKLTSEKRRRSTGASGSSTGGRNGCESSGEGDVMADVRQLDAVGVDESMWHGQTGTARVVHGSGLSGDVNSGGRGFANFKTTTESTRFSVNTVVQLNFEILKLCAPSDSISSQIIVNMTLIIIANRRRCGKQVQLIKIDDHECIIYTTYMYILS